MWNFAVFPIAIFKWKLKYKGTQLRFIRFIAGTNTCLIYSRKKAGDQTTGGSCTVRRPLGSQTYCCVPTYSNKSPTFKEKKTKNHNKNVRGTLFIVHLSMVDFGAHHVVCHDRFMRFFSCNKQQQQQQYPNDLVEQ